MTELICRFPQLCGSASKLQHPTFPQMGQISIHDVPNSVFWREKDDSMGYDYVGGIKVA